MYIAKPASYRVHPGDEQSQWKLLQATPEAAVATVLAKMLSVHPASLALAIPAAVSVYSGTALGHVMDNVSGCEVSELVL